METNKLSKYIDHSPLKMDASENEVLQFCDEAIQYDFHSVVIFPHYLKLARKKLFGSGVMLDTVVGFPFGNELIEIKSEQARKYLDIGADEIDMVMNISAFKSGHYDHVVKDIEAVLDKVRTYNAVLKVIIEIELLSDEEIVRASELVAAAGVDFVKTSVGLLKTSQPATVEKVKLMHDAVKSKNVKVKASGSIHSLDLMLKMIEAGASRIGTSKGIDIMRQLEKVNKREPLI